MENFSVSSRRTAESVCQGYGRKRPAGDVRGYRTPVGVIEKTEIRHLLGSHPYDLSGGEQQRAALAKVLCLTRRSSFWMNPTKGLDGFYKKKLAQILKGLTAEGKTILMVSHDIEFCAEYGDTCALFFHGSVVTSAPAREFFAGNSFYTTAANRMARKWYPDAVTAKDVIEGCRR